MQVLSILFVAGVTFAFPSPPVPRQAAGNQNAATAAADGNCNVAQVQQLADGIQQNLDIQAQEFDGILNLQAMLNGTANAGANANRPRANAGAGQQAQGQGQAEQQQAGQQQGQACALPTNAAPGNASANNPAFAAEQQRVLDIQNQGVKIREQNQAIAQQINSPALDGLNTVQMAQLLEIMQVMQLQGGGANDQMLLGMLVKEVQDGTKQNQKNLDAAKGQANQCKDQLQGQDQIQAAIQAAQLEDGVKGEQNANGQQAQGQKGQASA